MNTNYFAVSERSPRRSRRAIGVVAVATLAVAMFGGSATAGAATVAKKKPKSKTSTAANRQKALAAYAKCLSSKGIKLPANFGARRPGQGFGGSGSTPTSGANPNGTPPVSGAAGGGLRQAPSGVDPTQWAAAQKACASKRPSFGGGAAFNAYRACMTRNGVKSGTGANAARANTSDPTAQNAMKTCAPLRPTGPNGGPGATGGGAANTAPLQLSS